MAKLTAPTFLSTRLGPLAPAGTYVATCIGVFDQFGVSRPSFDNPSQTELQDVTRFIFGFRHTDGRIYYVESFEFKISGSPRSNLFKFLTGWLGHPPKMGWDYSELIGSGALVSVTHRQNRENTRTYATIASIAPVLPQLQNQVLPTSAFDPKVINNPSAATASPSGTKVSSAAPANDPTPQSWSVTENTTPGNPF